MSWTTGVWYQRRISLTVDYLMGIVRRECISSFLTQFIILMDIVCCRVFVAWLSCRQPGSQKRPHFLPWKSSLPFRFLCRTLLAHSALLKTNKLFKRQNITLHTVIIYLTFGLVKNTPWRKISRSEFIFINNVCILAISLSFCTAIRL
jgi:hypothetical protein